jgi:hypothetical protein
VPRPVSFVVKKGSNNLLRFSGRNAQPVSGANDLNAFLVWFVGGYANSCGDCNTAARLRGVWGVDNNIE